MKGVFIPRDGSNFVHLSVRMIVKFILLQGIQSQKISPIKKMSTPYLKGNVLPNLDANVTEDQIETLLATIYVTIQ